ncbi:hypothetical protein [Amycolatopsis dongchuanensis]|uniref:Uncharacterized protein n=1 Tax=Amycolatopsis dongchuanensis TaxID=1070866 RepID=A0ABP8VG56_9PSEU
MTRPDQWRLPLRADILRAAALRPHAPPRLLRAADAVLDGKFTWEEVASGQCAHPFARSLFTPKAQETVWPLLQQVADELTPPPELRVRRPPPADDDEDDDFSFRTYRVKGP